MSHVKISARDNSILTAVVVAENLLPEPLRSTAVAELVEYLPCPLREYGSTIARIRRNNVNVPGRGRGEITRGYIDGHQVRATDRW